MKMEEFIFSSCCDAVAITYLSGGEGVPVLTQLLLERLYLPVGSEQLGIPQKQLEEAAADRTRFPCSHPALID